MKLSEPVCLNDHISRLSSEVELWKESLAVTVFVGCEVRATIGLADDGGFWVA